MSVRLPPSPSDYSDKGADVLRRLLMLMAKRLDARLTKLEGDIAARQ